MTTTPGKPARSNGTRQCNDSKWNDRLWSSGGGKSGSSMGEISATVIVVRVWEPCESIVFLRNPIHQTAAVCVTPTDGKSANAIDAYVMRVAGHFTSDAEVKP